MLDSKHTATQQPFSDLEITAQAFIFLLAGTSSSHKCFFGGGGKYFLHSSHGLAEL